MTYNDTLTLLALAAVALQDASYEINFNLVSGSSNVTCAGTIPGTIAGATNTTLKDARFYVHDIKLISADGSKSNFTINNESKWQIGSGTNSFGAYTGVALLDFEDKTNNCTVGTTDTNKTVRGRLHLKGAIRECRIQNWRSLLPKSYEQCYCCSTNGFCWNVLGLGKWI
jgi:hypothetical protein